MNNQFEILIREKKGIKSRQWWAKEVKKVLSLAINILPNIYKKQLSKLSFTLLITKDKEIQNLNKQYRGKNKATDVLSFYLKRKDQIKQKYLGDIAISIDTAIKQAKIKKVPIESELILLFTHGYLHLLGFDHIEKKDAEIMFKFQNKILKEFYFN